MNTSFAFQPFQLDGLARAALVDGLILADEPGLGKTIAAFAWPLIKFKAQSAKCKVSDIVASQRPTLNIEPGTLNSVFRVLIIAPRDLHGQIAAEGLRHFGISTRTINAQHATFNAPSCAANNAGGSELNVEC